VSLLAARGPVNALESRCTSGGRNLKNEHGVGARKKVGSTNAANTLFTIGARLDTLHLPDSIDPHKDNWDEVMLDATE